MQVIVTEVSVPAFSTVGTGRGIDVESGAWVTFGGDHRPMRDIAEALSSRPQGEEDIVAEVPDWAILSVGPALGASS